MTPAFMAVGCLLFGWNHYAALSKKWRVNSQALIAGDYPHIIEQMEAYAKQAHTENITGQWIDQSKAFKGHGEK